MSFEGRVYAVTGAASGIGLSLTLKLVEAGAVVYASDVNGEGLAKTVEQCTSPQYIHPYIYIELCGRGGGMGLMVGKGLRGRIETNVLDVRNDGQVKEWIAGLVEKEGKLDGAANVAGVSGSSKPCSVENIVCLLSP